MSASDPIWWIELIKISPGLLAAALAIGVVVAYRKEIRRLLLEMTSLKAFGLEATFERDRKTLDDAIVVQGVEEVVSKDDRKGVLKRLHAIGRLLRDVPILWVDDNPRNNRHERALLQNYGARITIARTSAEAEHELWDSEYVLVITDLRREGRNSEGLDFVKRTIDLKTYRWTIAYTGTDQEGLPRPAYLFAITNRPDHLLHYVCDVIERERL